MKAQEDAKEMGFQDASPGDQSVPVEANPETKSVLQTCTRQTCCSRKGWVPATGDTSAPSAQK